MERKIGEIFEYNGEWYQCVEDSLDNCVNCCFYNGGHKKCSDKMGECFKGRRSDNNGVYFKKLEKVGEPYYNSDKKLCQQYKCYTEPLIADEIVYVFADNRAVIEIKQTKEDMEDNKKQTSLNSTKGIYEKFKGKTVQCLVNNKDGDLVNGYGIVCGYRDKYLIIGFTNEYEGCIKSFTDNVFLENRDFLSYRFWNISHVDDKPFIKPFNLEAAKAGKPVCTRDGRKARIVCFDRINARPILALVPSTDGKGEDVFDCFVNGKRGANALESDLDLMMLPEKKEGWVNVYKDSVYDTKEEALTGRLGNRGYINTIKVRWEE